MCIDMFIYVYYTLYFWGEKMNNSVKINLNGATLEIPLIEKVFSTGSRGYNATGKFNDGEGKRYQISFNVIELGTKPK